jgi:hypothetical protein
LTTRQRKNATNKTPIANTREKTFLFFEGREGGNRADFGGFIFPRPPDKADRSGVHAYNYTKYQFCVVIGIII